jgi:hypothetical protein
LHAAPIRFHSCTDVARALPMAREIQPTVIGASDYLVEIPDKIELVAHARTRVPTAGRTR